MRPSLQARALAAALRVARRGPEPFFRMELVERAFGPRRVPVAMSSVEQLRTARGGFLPTSHVLYELDRTDPRNYLSDRQRERTHRLNGPSGGVLDDKLAMYLLLATAGAPIPEVFGVTVGDRAAPLGGTARPADAWLAELVAARGRVVRKPLRGRHGGDFRVVGAAPAATASTGTDIVTAYVEQAAEIGRVYPDTTNAIRVLTMHDDDGAFVAAASQRFGTSSSRPVDNFEDGGLTAPVDLVTGTLGAGVSFGRDAVRRLHASHPDTGERIDGMTVPNWTQLRDGIVAIAGRLSMLRYVGWDVAVTDSGFVVLEGNRSPSVQVHQAHAGLLRDPRVRAFYAARGVL